MKYIALFCVLALPLSASAQDVLKPRHDTVKNSIRDVRATVDTTHTIINGAVTSTIPGVLGDPIPGCVGRVCGGAVP